VGAVSNLQGFRGYGGECGLQACTGAYVSDVRGGLLGCAAVGIYQGTQTH
jgi:hypothetical protein